MRVREKKIIIYDPYKNNVAITTVAKVLEAFRCVKRDITRNFYTDSADLYAAMLLKLNLPVTLRADGMVDHHNRLVCIDGLYMVLQSTKLSEFSDAYVMHFRSDTELNTYYSDLLIVGPNTTEDECNILAMRAINGRECKPVHDGLCFTTTYSANPYGPDVRFAYRDAAYFKPPVDKVGKLPRIVDVKFNGPATIVFWSDKTKTVVKCGPNDELDYEKGLAMAIAKKCLGTNASQSNFNDKIRKWLPEIDENEAEK